MRISRTLFGVILLAAALPSFAAEPVTATSVLEAVEQKKSDRDRVAFLKANANALVEGMGTLESLAPRRFFDTSVPDTYAVVAMIKIDDSRKIVCGVPKETLDSLGWELMELQKKNPPFGGFEGVPITEMRRIFISPGPIYEPGEADYSELGWAQGMYAGGFRPGDITINTFSYHMVPFALQMLDNSLHMIGCISIPMGVGNTEQQVHILKDFKATGYCGTPSFLLNIVEKAEEMGLDLKRDLNLRVAFVAAEMLPESLRSRLEEKFGMIMRQAYGTADIRCLGYECLKKNGMHVPDDKIVDRRS